MSDAAELYGYTPEPIDINLGVTIRSTRDGRQVIMYKQKPGLFLTPDGRVASDQMAKAAGFEVEALRHEARVRSEIAEATAGIQKRAAEEEAEIRRRLAKEAAENPFQGPQIDPVFGVAITKRNSLGSPRATTDFEMLHIGAGKWDVIATKSNEKVVEMTPTDTAMELMIEAQRQVDAAGASAES